MRRRSGIVPRRPRHYPVFRTATPGNNGAVALRPSFGLASRESAPHRPAWPFRSPRLIGDVIDIRREEALIGFMHTGSYICPPQECLHKSRAVVSPHLQLQVGVARVQAHAMHSLHARHRVVVAAPNRLRAVGVFFNLKVDRQKGRGAMMLGPVKLYATANPRACQPNQRGLDNGLAIDGLVTIGLVLQRVDAPPPQLGQHHNPNKLVL